MIDLVQDAFRRVVTVIESDFRQTAGGCWTESVLRYFYCRCIAEVDPMVKLLVECNRIDLVLVRDDARAFIEFKFYRHVARLDPYTSALCGKKGFPSRKNRQEFESCVDLLSSRKSLPQLSKYIVLVYADPAPEVPGGPRYGEHYDKYRHTRDDVDLRIVESRSIILGSERVTAQLYEIRSVPTV